MIRPLTRETIDSAARAIRALLYTRLDPSLYGARLARKMAAARVALLASSAVIAIAPLQSLLRIPLSTALALSAVLIDRIFVSIAGSGIDDEVPSLILYLLPYAWSTQTVADLIAQLEGFSKGFRWLRLEASRLRMFLESGFDPITALRRLADSTPSKSFRDLLEEVSHASRIGYSRIALLSRLAERALDGLRGRWASYAELARTVSEINAAIVVSMGALAPLSAFTGMGISIYYILLLVPAILALGLALLQPSSGPGRTGMAARILPLLVALSSSVMVLAWSTGEALAILVSGAVAVEVYGVLHGRRVSRGLNALAQAAREARLGRPVEGLLRSAYSLDEPVISAILESTRIAGLARAWIGVDLLERAYRGAQRAIESLRSSGLVSLAVSLMALLTAWYGIEMLSSMSSNAFQVAPAAIAAAKFLEAAAPLVGVPVGMLLRPRVPSLLPSALLLGSLIIVSSMHLDISSILG